MGWRELACARGQGLCCWAERGGQGGPHAWPGRGCRPAETVVCGWIVSGLQAYAAHRLCCGFALHSWHFCSCLGPSRPVTLGYTWVCPSQRLLGSGPLHSCEPCALEPRASASPPCVRVHGGDGGSAHREPSTDLGVSGLPVQKHVTPALGTPSFLCLGPVFWRNKAPGWWLFTGAPAWRPTVMVAPVLALCQGVPTRCPPHFARSRLGVPGGGVAVPGVSGRVPRAAVQPGPGSATSGERPLVGTSHILGGGKEGQGTVPLACHWPSRGPLSREAEEGGTLISPGGWAVGSVLPGAGGPPCLPGLSLTRTCRPGESLRSAGALPGPASVGWLGHDGGLTMPCVSTRSRHRGTGSGMAHLGPRESHKLQARGGRGPPLPLVGDPELRASRRSPGTSCVHSCLQS